MIRWTRKAFAVAALTALTLGLPASNVPAQEPAPEGGEEEKGRPVDGYIATSVIAFGILFIVGKSARR